MQDAWQLFDYDFSSRLLVGTALYPSPEIMLASVQSANAAMVTVSLRRQGNDSSHNEFWQMVKDTKVPVLPNTAGCHSIKEVMTIAQMSREVFETPLIKVEITGDDYNLQPDPFGLLESCKLLLKEGFKVMPYCTDDLVVCQRLVDLGCEVIMPWAAPIGTGKGILNPYALRTLRERLPATKLLVDAGIGAPSHACQVMEMGFDGVLLNSAIALAQDPVTMASAFADAVSSGRRAYLAGQMIEKDLASPSTPLVGMPIWHQD